MDGAQNGVRHAHALAMINDPKSVDDLADLVSNGTGKKRDFYHDLRNTTRDSLAKMDHPLAKFWSELDILAPGDESAAARTGRKFTKKPVMILPYGAGRKSIRNSIESFLNKDGAEVLAKMEAEGISRKEAVDFLADQWYGNKQEQISSLVREALELPEADVMMDTILKDIARKDPLFIGSKHDADDGSGRPLIEQQYERMIEAANEIADRTGQNVDDVFMALQIEARARAITQSENISPEMASQMARRQFAKELALVQSGSRDTIVAAAKAGQLTFFERQLQDLMRVEYTEAGAAQARASKAMTGQEDADFGLPAEAEGKMFFI